MDDLGALLASRQWVTRRVDRIEFLDLTTVRRTIVFTFDLTALNAMRSRSCDPIPLGWFMPWANAETVLVDAKQRVTAYATSRESDDRVAAQICQRLCELRMGDSTCLVERIREHRDKAHDPESGCGCWAACDCDPGFVQLMHDKWGCRAVRELLARLHERHGNHDTDDGKKAAQLVQILLAWQTNFVLFAHLDTSSVVCGRAMLQLSYDEEQQEWEPPWERRKRELGGSRLSWAEGRECREHISRGSPFSEDLDALFPWGLRGCLARRRSRLLRSLGRRGPLGLAWHVAWQQASGLDVDDHRVEVTLPPELTAVRMRMLRTSGIRRYATRADQVGSRATIVAPPVPAEDRRGCPPLPTLLSLVIAQRSAASWYGGVWIALLTGVAILAAAVWRLPDVVANTDAAAAVLVVAPTLVSTLLAVRAGSEIAEQLTAALRLLIGTVGALAAICAVGLVVQHVPPAPHAADLTFLGWLWAMAGMVMLYIAAALFCGAHRIRRLIAYGHSLSPRDIRDDRIGKVLNPEQAPRIPPPDRWLAANEGDLVPWGWLYAAPDRTDKTRADGCFWQGSHQADLVSWVHEIFGFRPQRV